MSESINRIRNAFNSTVSEFEKHFGITADYSPDSIALLEGTFDEMYPLGTAPHPNTVTVTGYYVGEVFIRNIVGAAWDDTLFQNNQLTIALKVQGSILVVTPMEMVSDYITHPGNSISRLLQFYSEIASGERVIDENGNVSGRQLAGVGYTIYGGKNEDNK